MKNIKDKKVMRTFLIHQQVKPLESRNSEFEMVGIVKAVSHNAVFTATQNFEEHWNTDEPCRSTMVGDVIEDITRDLETPICYRIDDVGLSVTEHPNQELLDLMKNPQLWKDLNLTVQKYPVLEKIYKRKRV